jgi:transcriptional regulator with XRE-family HTH domain
MHGRRTHAHRPTVTGVDARTQNPEWMTAARSTDPLAVQLPALMRERGWSVNRLAAEIGVSQSHLSRVLRGVNGKIASGELAERVAGALGLSADWFPEARQARLFTVIGADPSLRDRLYDELVHPPGPRVPTRRCRA